MAKCKFELDDFYPGLTIDTKDNKFEINLDYEPGVGCRIDAQGMQSTISNPGEFSAGDAAYDSYKCIIGIVNDFLNSKFKKGQSVTDNMLRSAITGNPSTYASIRMFFDLNYIYQTEVFLKMFPQK